MPIPVEIGVYINNVKDEMRSKGMKTEKIFYGGHSLGGSTMASYIKDNFEDAEGTFAWGAYTNIGIEDPAKNYPSPFLTVGAEFDGWMARITRISESYYYMKHSSLNETAALERYPVVVIPGCNHASFLSGIAPSKVQETDLRAFRPFDDLVTDIVEVTSTFITVTRMNNL